MPVIRLSGKAVEWRRRESARARRVSLRLGPDGVVELVTPIGVVVDPAALLRQHADWILQHLERMREGPVTPAIESGTILPYKGGTVRVAVLPGTPEVRLERGVLMVTAPEDRIEGYVRYWLREEARRAVTDAVERWSTLMGVTYGRITIKDQRSRWGSCSSHGNLNFNWRLVLAPPEVLEYVVIHELAHLIEPNHSARFWDVVRRFCSGYNEQLRWLRTHGAELGAVLPR